LACEQLLIVKTFGLASEAAPWQVELGQGFSLFLSMLLRARVFELGDYRLSSLDHVLHTCQRRGFLALGGMSFYSCLFAQSCARMFDLSYSRLSSLDPVLQSHPRRGFLAFAGRHTHMHDGKLPQAMRSGLHSDPADGGMHEVWPA